jgi:hypothetical protein
VANGRGRALLSWLARPAANIVSPRRRDAVVVRA